MVPGKAKSLSGSCACQLQNQMRQQGAVGFDFNKTRAHHPCTTYCVQFADFRLRLRHVQHNPPKASRGEAGSGTFWVWSGFMAYSQRTLNIVSEEKDPLVWVRVTKYNPWSFISAGHSSRVSSGAIGPGSVSQIFVTNPVVSSNSPSQTLMAYDRCKQKRQAHGFGKYHTRGAGVKPFSAEGRRGESDKMKGGTETLPFIKLAAQLEDHLSTVIGHPAILHRWSRRALDISPAAVIMPP